MFYIAYDGGCSSCSNIATLVEEESSGKLMIRTVDSFVNEYGAKIPIQKPSLIEIEDSSVKNIYTGPAMSIKILKLVGPQKAARIFSILSAESRNGNINRRLTLTGVVATLGIALTGASWSPATAQTPEATVKERVKVFADVKKHPNFKSAAEKAQKDGYSIEKSEYVVIKQDSEFLFFFFMESLNRPKTDAAVISCLISETKFDFSLEYVSGSVSGVTTASSAGQALTFTKPSGYEQLPMGPAEYFGCIAFCVGANCGARAARCRFLIHMAAVLACMTAICGSKVRTCHGVCQKSW